MRSTVAPVVGILALIPALAGPARALGQVTTPEYAAARGSTVTPAYEGWHPNPDGTVTLSWGFYNRNTEEDLRIPLGPDNFVEPAALHGVQPTHLPAGRRWGVFGVVIPADFEEEVRWTLRIRGGTFSVPANLSPEWEIPGPGGDARGGLSPELSFAEGGPWTSGPAGGTADATGEAGAAVALDVWVRPAGAAGARGTGEPPPITLRWAGHAGPGDVSFADADAPAIPVLGGRVTTEVTFSEPGDYVVRVRASHTSDRVAEGHAQCCWSNAFFRVTVREAR